jgi:hypothetical protein
MYVEVSQQLGIVAGADATEELPTSLVSESPIESNSKPYQDESVLSLRGKDIAKTVVTSNISDNVVAQASEGSKVKLCNCVYVNRELVAEFEGMKLDLTILYKRKAAARALFRVVD